MIAIVLQIVGAVTVAYWFIKWTSSLLKKPKKQVLTIRCSDGRSRKMPDIRGHWNHQIRFPGGILLPYFCTSKNGFDLGDCFKDYEKFVFLCIEIMVKLKHPEKIVLLGHFQCGVADALGLKKEEIRDIYLDWERKLSVLYPDIVIEAKFETHSDCGEHHYGYEDVKQVA